MSKQLNQSKSSFAPKKMIPVTLNKTTVYLYPTLSNTMNVNKRTHRFTVTKNALAVTPSVPWKTKLECLKQQTNSVSTVDVIASCYTNHSNKFITCVANLNIQSYHGSNGNVINNCIDPTTGHLKPLNRVTDTNCCLNGIKYAKVSTNLDFSMINFEYTTNHPFSFYIDLLIQSRTVQNESNRNVEITTFVRAADWLHENQVQFDNVFNHVRSSKKPFNLKKPEFDGDANIDIQSSMNAVEEISLKASWEEATRSIYREICPVSVSDPITALQNICQTVTNPDTGEIISSSVMDYYNAIKQVSEFLAGLGTG